MITTFGIIWIPICIIVFFKPTNELVRLLFISSIFQSASVLNIGTKGVTLVTIVEILLVIKYAMIRKKIKKDYKTKKQTNIEYLFILFFLIVIINSLLASILFENLNYEIVPKYGEPVKIEYGSSMIIKFFNLALHILTCIILFKIRNILEPKEIFKSAMIMIMIAIIFGMWEYLWKITNMRIYFPSNLIYNNTNYSQGFDQGYIEGRNNITNVRMNSTFLEPSYFGGFISPATIGLIATQKNIKNKENRKKFLAITLMGLISIVLNMSGTGIICFVILVLIYFFTNKNIQKKNLLRVSMLIFIALIVLEKTGLLNRIVDMVVSKSNSISGTGRKEMNNIGWQLIKKTWGLGAGINSYRCSSFIIQLLATLGVVPTFILINITVKLLKAMKKKDRTIEKEWGFYFLLGVIISMVIAIPDLNYTILWIAIFYTLLMTQKGEKENE